MTTTIENTEVKVISLNDMPSAQIVTMSVADVRANLKAIIDYCDSLLTRSAVIYQLIRSTAEAGNEKPVVFLISNAFGEVWPKSDTADKDGVFPLLGFSTVELHVRNEKLVLTEDQQDAYKKVNAFKKWCERQDKGDTSAPAAKVLPKKLVDAINKLRGLIEQAEIVEREVEDEEGNVTLVETPVIKVSDLSALIEVISQV